METTIDFKPSISLSPLLNYPDEILLAILGFISSCDLFKLATLCKRLHFMALPVYYQFHNLSLSSSMDLALNDQGLNALPGLLISLSPKTFRRLTCCFPTDENAFLAGARRLCTFVTQLTCLSEVSLEFRPIEPTYPALELDPSSWDQPLERLMNAVGASGCAVLTLRGALTCPSWLHSYVPTPRPPSSLPLTSDLISKLRQGYKSTKKLWKLTKRRTRHNPASEEDLVVPAKDAALLSINTVSISSAMFFFRVMPTWTIQTLSSAPITTLCLTNIQYYYPRDWHYVLASVHMPFLQDLTIKSCTITFTTLSDILRRHPRIATLTINALFEHDGGNGWIPISTATRAPSLTSLIAPAGYIPQFLTHAKTVPNLVNLTILAADVHGRTGMPEFARVWWGALHHVSERIKNCTLALDITLPYHSGFKHLLMEEDEGRVYLAALERLVIRPGDRGEYLMKEYWARFREWLECFSALVELEIIDSEGDNGVLTDEKEKRAFVHEMMPVFARVSKVKLHGQSLW